MRRFFPTSRVALALAAGVRAQSTAEKKLTIPEGAKERKELFDKLTKSVEEHKKSVDESKKNILYTAAEAQNIRRKFNDEIDAAKSEAVLNFGKDMIEISDSLIAVCRSIAEYRKKKENIEPKVSSLFSGVDLSLKVVDSVLGRHGIKKVDIPLGSKYNPDTSVHTFTSPETPEVPAGCVTEVVKQAYSYNGNIVRHAEVGIAEKPDKDVSP
ncbi:molecular chaperone GrpE [Angomonas deanei]|uniref:GrpE, putative n=1 Tax=Angomonas deanei TaxID=59799 RepID=A0A7G2CIZ9_9TRYP|nr:molecular chaperone GrpE [Angomonas deanei]CAD2218232.1 GrpE, putative [Angomonas deanei]|eukprot:EPY22451.1 molecular chaperone GrpE [Angomonas deanei]